jgi:transcriptional regulator with GAF, ATPase, and Fis domain
MRAHLGVPLRSGNRIFSAIGFASFRSSRSWSEHIITRLQIIGELFVGAIERSRADTALMDAKVEIRQLRERLQAGNANLHRTARNRVAVKLNSRSARFNQVIEEISQVAATRSTVLLLGETGTGKEVLAGLIHELSPRQSRPMVKINCAALPATLIEAELFGREKGAHTGALARQMGRFELAHGATILLDEIGELPLELQPKLLRVLQSGEFERIREDSMAQLQAYPWPGNIRELRNVIERAMILARTPVLEVMLQRTAPPPVLLFRQRRGRAAVAAQPHPERAQSDRLAHPRPRWCRRAARHETDHARIAHAETEY